MLGGKWINEASCCLRSSFFKVESGHVPNFIRIYNKNDRMFLDDTDLKNLQDHLLASSTTDLRQICKQENMHGYSVLNKGKLGLHVNSCFFLNNYKYQK